MQEPFFECLIGIPGEESPAFLHSSEVVDAVDARKGVQVKIFKQKLFGGPVMLENKAQAKKWQREINKIWNR